MNFKFDVIKEMLKTGSFYIYFMCMLSRCYLNFIFSNIFSTEND